ncbi:MAG: SAM-dependent methyltransferase, partial [Ktedonobacteraceae bacterium]|nr:SAM-dependent methyltransferase [Ktedonobacteraceae bacterium]
FTLHKQFRLIYMLENAFQFFLTREDQEGLLAHVREHLQPDGCFLFETRNPTPKILTEGRRPQGEKFTTPDGGQLVTTEKQHYDPLTQIQHYIYHHALHHPDGQREEKDLRTALRYTYPQELEALLHYNGLQIRTIYGNWQQDPLTATSPSMICICQKRI